MAKNPYFNDEQRRRSQNPQPAPPVRKLNASLDKASMQELKDINNNTLETAINTLDIKEGFKSFEDKFAEKFSGFKDQYDQEQQPLADQLPDFVGPARPSLNDNSTNSVNNSVILASQAFDAIEEHTRTISESIAEFIKLATKKAPKPKPEPEPEPVPEQEPEVDQTKKLIKDKDKEEKKFSSSVLAMLGAIKDNTSGILARFIGYSLEALAKFAKWTLIIGSVVFAIDVLSKVIQKWFEDILNEGEASKELFGSYFNNIKALAEKIKDGLDNFDMKNLGTSLKNLFMEPFAVLGNTIKTAITEGIGNLIYALGQHTGSETITDAGRGMKVSALRDKQKYGLDIDSDDLIMLREQEIKEQRDKITDARSKVVDEVKATQGMFQGGAYMYGGQPTQAQQMQEKHLAELRDQVELEEKITKEREKELQTLKDSPTMLQEQVQKENTENRNRVNVAKQNEMVQKDNKPKADSEFDRGDSILGKDDIDGKDKETMEKILESLEEKNNSNKLNSDDKERFQDMIDQWQNKISAVPESNAAIDKQPEQAQTQTAQAQANNVQVNQKTVNNVVQQSVQRTDRKPLVSIA